MNEPTNKRTVAVGFFILTGLIFLIIGILLVGNLHETFKEKMKVVALFDDVGGLQKGNNIWFSGVKIGVVSNLHFHGKSQVEVTMKIETKAQQYIRKDAMVKISSDGLIGNKILVIYGGTAESEEVNEGDTLGVEKTFTSEDMINMLQENNKNFLAITTDFKSISKKLDSGQGTVGKLLQDESLYNNLNAASAVLYRSTLQADQMLVRLNAFSAGLNRKGTLANELTTDTIVFKSLRASVASLQKMADTGRVFINQLKNTADNPNTAMGVLLHDEATGNSLKVLIRNLESGSAKLDQDLEAAQHSILLRGYFKKKVKKEKALPEK